MTVWTALFSPSKTQNHMSSLSLYQQKTVKNYGNYSTNDLNDHFIRMNVKQKVRIKKTANGYKYFFESNFLEVNS